MQPQMPLDNTATATSTGSSHYSDIGRLDFEQAKSSIVRDLCHNIRNTISEEEWQNYVKIVNSRDSTTADKLKLFYKSRRKEIEALVEENLKLHPATKDKERALLLKNVGNKVFGCGDNEKSLHLYTQSLAWMPHNDGTKDAAVLYANRSAALFHLGEFFLSKRDAELAFALHYPEELHYKLYERVGRCCLQLGMEKEATTNLRAAIKSLDHIGCGLASDPVKKNKTKKALEEVIKNVGITTNNLMRGRSEKGSQESSSSSSFPAGGEGSQGPVLPEVVGGRNKYLLAASSHLSLQYKESQGRFVTTNEYLRPGDVILVEKPFVSVLNSEHYHLQCFQCYAPMKAPIVCETCILVSFCSNECKAKARGTHHRSECPILGILKNSGISVICNMALRIFTQTDPKTVLSWYDLVSKTEERREGDCRSGPKDGRGSHEGNNNSSSNSHRAFLRRAGFMEEYPTNHVALFNLVTHEGEKKPEDYFHHIIMTLYLFHILKRTTYFKPFEKEKDNPGTKEKVGQSSTSEEGESCGNSVIEMEDEVELKFVVILFRCLGALHFNTHETSGWDQDREKDHSVGLGGAVYPTLALFNHSCNPAVVRYFVNDTVIVRAIRTVLPGEMVAENYGPSFANTPREERLQRLMENYKFLCDCKACREDWTTFDKLTNEMMKFRCANCRTFICKSDEKMGILFKCGKCGKMVNILTTLQSLTQTDKKYNTAVEFINKGQVETGMGMLVDNLSLLESLLMPPFKEMHMCQEYIRRCLLSTGNAISKLPQWDPEKAVASEDKSSA